MAANLLRLQLTNIDIETSSACSTRPTGPSRASSTLFLGFWEQSQIVIKPRNFGDSVAPLALVVGSIKTSIFDVAAPILEDAELQWEVRRWLTGDPEPWPGAGHQLAQRHPVGRASSTSPGSGTGTSLGGNLLTGLTRTIADVLSNHVEDSYDLFTGDTIDETGYRLPGILGTLPRAPVCGVPRRRHHRHPNQRVLPVAGRSGRITVGGQSMPGVNEFISAAVNMAAMCWATTCRAISAVAGVNVTVGSLGGALDSFLNPIYRDSILATSACRCCCGSRSRAGATTSRPPAPT
jgi:hypothetical protein